MAGHEHTLDALLTAYQATTGELRLKGGEYHGPCPNCGGDPAKPSDRFWIKKDRTIGCRQCGDFGAIMVALGLSKKAPENEPGVYVGGEGEAVEFPQPEPEPEPYGCTLAQYAERAGLPADWLMSDNVMLRDGQTFIRGVGPVASVVMPYTDEAGDLTCTKHRVKLSGPDKYRYETGSKAALYGENWLPAAQARNGKLIVVEGESDTQTLWFHQIAAVGVPGCNSLKVLRLEHFEGIHQVFVVAEKDESGQRFPQGVADRLRELGVAAVVLKVDLDEQDTNASYRKDPATFRRRFLVACRYARGLRRSSISAREFKTAREILATEYPPVRWIVPGILPEGLALMIAAPKVGKSFAAMDLAVRVSRGEHVFGSWATEQGEVLYVDLEMPVGAKMKARLRMLRAEHDRDGLYVIDRWPKLGQGCCEELDIWFEEHPRARLAIIDTFGQIKGDVQGNVYDKEREMMRSLQRVADHRHVAIMVIHHDKKLPGTTDPTEASSGTKAITGGAGAIWWLQRTFGTRDGKLILTGRDVEECEMKAQLNMCRWWIEKPAAEKDDTGKGWGP